MFICIEEHKYISLVRAQSVWDQIRVLKCASFVRKLLKHTNTHSGSM